MNNWTKFKRWLSYLEAFRDAERDCPGFGADGPLRFEAFGNGGGGRNPGHGEARLGRVIPE